MRQTIACVSRGAGRSAAEHVAELWWSPCGAPSAMPASTRRGRTFDARTEVGLAPATNRGALGRKRAQSLRRRATRSGFASVRRALRPRGPRALSALDGHARRQFEREVGSYSTARGRTRSSRPVSFAPSRVSPRSPSSPSRNPSSATATMGGTPPSATAFARPIADPPPTAREGRARAFDVGAYDVARARRECIAARMSADASAGRAGARCAALCRDHWSRSGRWFAPPTRPTTSGSRSSAPGRKTTRVAGLNHETAAEQRVAQRGDRSASSGVVISSSARRFARMARTAAISSCSTSWPIPG